MKSQKDPLGRTDLELMAARHWSEHTSDRDKQRDGFILKQIYEEACRPNDLLSWFKEKE